MGGVFGFGFVGKALCVDCFSVISPMKKELVASLTDSCFTKS